ncbi:MAG: GIY-YIG nuclease family protein [Pseudomonadota bacterium]|nr:GIY-YIG nuclease family protein [Pseudomonadota bacterium]
MLRFNIVLREAGIEPSTVRLLRHQPILPNGIALIDQFHRDRVKLLAWQSVQSVKRRPHLSARYWTAFVGTPDGRSILEGVYEVVAREEVQQVSEDPLTGQLNPAGTCDRYTLAPIEQFELYSGRLMIDWGRGASGRRAWIQRADNQDKPITAILERPFEQPFPGYLAFRHTIGGLNLLSPNWAEALRRAKGVYLLSCPATGMLYTGSATGADGFWGRWQEYFLTGHGGNLGLVGHDTSKFAVTILQVSSSTETAEDIIADEQVWKTKLLSREFGLNRN